MIEENSLRKIPLNRPKVRCEYSVKREIERMEPGTKWREAAEDRDKWQSLSFAVWS